MSDVFIDLKFVQKGKEFKVGDKVFDLRCGNGVVGRIRDFHSYPISVSFKNALMCYSVDGKNDITDILPSLYHGHDLIVEVKEPEYEWQVLYKIKNSDKGFSVSQYYYKTVQNFKDSTVRDNQYDYCEFIELSKRLVKRG